MHSFSSSGIILKRSDIGEMDRVVTVFTKEFGKLTTIAKGCRKMTSSKLSALEPGTFSKIHLIKTHSMPILTQASIINDFSGSRTDLTSFRKVFEILEIVDSLLVDEDDQPFVFDKTIEMLTHLHSQTPANAGFIRTRLSQIIESLGFSHQAEVDIQKPVKDLVEEITQRKLKAYAFLNL